MDQGQRDKIAWVLAVVLGLVLIYLLAVNVFKGGKRSAPPPTSPPAAVSGALAPIPIVADVAPPTSAGAQVPIQAPEPALDPKVLAEQQEISARLPRRNPFSAVKDGLSTETFRKGGTTDSGQWTGNNEIKLKVSAIVSRQGSNKRIAMINGKMLEEGDCIGDWTILRVNTKNVVLGNGSQQRVVGVK